MTNRYTGSGYYTFIEHRYRGCDCPERDGNSDWLGIHFPACTVAQPWKSAFLEQHRQAATVPAKLIGNGEGFTTLVLTDPESRCIRNVLTKLEAIGSGQVADEARSALRDFNRGIQRATDRIKAEFDAEQKAEGRRR